jgi:hypothetical protein
VQFICGWNDRMCHNLLVNCAIISHLGLQT